MAGSIDARLSKAQPGDVLDTSKLSFTQVSKASSRTPPWSSGRAAALPAERSSLALYGSYLLVNREGVFSSCPEDFRARGLYLATKQVTAAYDTVAGNRWLPVDHFFCTGSSPTQDGPTHDGWVPGQDNTPRAPGDTVTLGDYLPGNFGVAYRFLPQLTGSSQVAVLPGGNVSLPWRVLLLPYRQR